MILSAPLVALLGGLAFATPCSASDVMVASMGYDSGGDGPFDEGVFFALAHGFELDPRGELFSSFDRGHGSRGFEAEGCAATHASDGGLFVGLFVVLFGLRRRAKPPASR